MQLLESEYSAALQNVKLIVIVVAVQVETDSDDDLVSGREDKLKLEADVDTSVLPVHSLWELVAES